jgi:hypothetical protein
MKNVIVSTIAGALYKMTASVMTLGISDSEYAYIDGQVIVSPPPDDEREMGQLEITFQLIPLFIIIGVVMNVCVYSVLFLDGFLQELIIAAACLPMILVAIVVQYAEVPNFPSGSRSSERQLWGLSAEDGDPE